jgi:serine/threonine-protein kinase
VQPEVPAEIDAICRKALALLPEDRYATAADMLADLEAFLAKRTLQARRDLVSLVTKLFAKERTNIRQVLNESVGALAVDTFVPRNSGLPLAAPTPAGSFFPTASAGNVPVAPSSIAPMTLGEASEPRIRALPIAIEGRPLADVLEPAPTRLAPAASARESRPSAGFAVLGAAAFLLVAGVLGSSARLAVARTAVSSAAAAGSAVTSPRVATVHAARGLVRATDTLTATSRRTPGAGAPAQSAATAAALAPTGVTPSAAFAPRRAPSARHLKLDSGDPWATGAKP